MAYAPDSQTFTLNFPEDIWTVLDAVAKKEGHANTRQYINAVTRSVGQAAQNQAVLCEGRKKKRQNIYRIPRHLEKPHAQLSCKLNTPTSSIMTACLIAAVLQELNGPAV